MPEPSDFFECRMCGDCCQGFGGTYLTSQDIEALSRHCNVTPDIFLRRYCHMSGKKPVLKTAESGYCIFWNDVCTVHDIKPRMCKLWPFIEGVLRDPANWETMHSMCPGIRTDVDMEKLLTCIKQVLTGFERKVS